MSDPLYPRHGADFESCAIGTQAELVRLREEVTALRLQARVKLWECPECAFGMDATHTNADGTITCPCCAELRLSAQVATLRAALAECQEACRLNLVYASRKDEHVLFKAWNGAALALASAPAPSNANDTLSDLMKSAAPVMRASVETADKWHLCHHDVLKRGCHDCSSAARDLAVAEAVAQAFRDSEWNGDDIDLAAVIASVPHV